MSRSFREAFLAPCSKPLRQWHQGRPHKAARSLRRRLGTMLDEDGIPMMPRNINRKWMGGFAWRRWRMPNYENEIILRNCRKFLLIHDDWEVSKNIWL